MITGKQFNDRYNIDVIEKETMRNVSDFVNEKGRIGAVNEITESLKSDMRKQQLTKEEQGRIKYDERFK